MVGFAVTCATKDGLTRRPIRRRLTCV